MCPVRYRYCESPRSQHRFGHRGLLPHSIRDWVAGHFVALGTDGFGMSETRAALRDYFEVDARHIAYYTIEALVRQGKLESKTLDAARRKLEIEPDKPVAFNG